MSLVTTSEPGGELLTVEDAKRHLRFYGSGLDDEIASLIRTARDYCERNTQRTLRTAVVRTLKLPCWWSCGVDLPWPPLLSSPALAVTYYDGNNASQTLGAGNYEVVYSTNGGGRLKWSDTATIPTTYVREDAVQIAFSTGYADATALPPVALQAMKLAAEMYWVKDPEQVRSLDRCIKNLLGPIDWSGYA